MMGTDVLGGGRDHLTVVRVTSGCSRIKEVFECYYTVAVISMSDQMVARREASNFSPLFFPRLVHLKLLIRPDLSFILLLRSGPGCLDCFVPREMAATVPLTRSNEEWAQPYTHYLNVGYQVGMQHAARISIRLSGMSTIRNGS